MTFYSSVKEKYDINCLWQEKFNYDFNVLIADTVFKEKTICIITGCDNGIVRVHRPLNEDNILHGFDKEGQCFETKGGPIQTLLSANVTRFNFNDVLVCDTNGVFTIMTNGQILNRRLICLSKITTQILLRDSADSISIVTGSSCGTLLAVSPYEIIWKCRVPELLKHESQRTTTSITCLHCLSINSSTCETNYILVADSNNCVHLFLNSCLIATFNVLSQVTSMCSGIFLTESENTKVQKHFSGNQVAMATLSGSIYVLSNMNVLSYCNLSFPITNIRTLIATGADEVDAILCAGHFNSLRIVQNGVCVTTFNTSDWVHVFAVLKGAGESNLLVLGCLDRTVRLVKIVKNR
ncbi:uncharacterized protein LOC100213574 isoform X4 [Hydra vulgaris]|uniref:Uncharacterized protein LOC100213574 isoform X4 n=1 Tax=Hydra vulgaris TaxID=6087 RepID=A0ABM4CKI4_HYDVU